MNFESYTQLIMQSVSECGYDDFLPSLCRSIVGAEELRVLRTDLHSHGEKEIALDWAYQFAEENRKLYCVYRVGSRRIVAVEVTGSEVTDKTQIEVRSHDDSE